MINEQVFISATGFDQLPILLKNWQQKYPACGCLVLLPEAEKARVASIQSAFNALEMPLLGGVFPQLIGSGNWQHEGAWVLLFIEMPTAFLLPLDEGREDIFAQAVGQSLEGDLHVALPGQTPTLFMIFDGMLPNIGTALHQLYQTLRTQVVYCGVNAGSETFQPMACLFDNDQLIERAVMGFLLNDAPKISVGHGYPVSKALMRATSATGNQIHQIDGRPAFEAYQSVIKSEYGVVLTRENFYEYAVHFPFGLVTTLEVLVRIPVAFSADGALICVGEVPANSTLRLLRAPKLSESVCVDRLVQDLGAQEKVGTNLLTFYCAGRRMHFGAEALDELQTLKQRSGVSEVIGALTLGEIDTDPDLGMPRFHNATLVCVAVGDTRFGA